jgi:hypothetical protein
MTSRQILVLALAAFLAACPNSSQTKGDKPSPVPGPAPAPAAPAADAGVKAEGQGFTLEVQAPAEGAVGAAVTAQVILHSRDGYHVNKDYPIELTVTPAAGVEVAKTSLEAADGKIEEAQASFPVAMTAKDAGAKKMGAALDFGICITPAGGRQECRVFTVPLAWTMVVK